MGAAALASFFTGTEIKAEQTIFLIAFGFEGIVLLAAAFFSFQKFLQKTSVDEEVSFSISDWWIVVFASMACASILIGYQIGGIKTINWLFLPILTIPAIVLPLGALLGLGTQKLPLGTRWQIWNVLGLGMTLTPFVLFTLEIVVAIFIFSALLPTSSHNQNWHLNSKNFRSKL